MDRRVKLLAELAERLELQVARHGSCIVVGPGRTPLPRSRPRNRQAAREAEVEAGGSGREATTSPVPDGEDR